MADSELSWNDMRRGVASLCEQRGWHHGVPIMSSTDTSRRIVLAKGCPLSDKYGHNVPVRMDGGVHVQACSNHDVNEEDDFPVVVNTWLTKPVGIGVLRSRRGAKVVRVDTSRDRLDLLMRTMICQAGAVDSDTEIKAMISLKARINENQWDSYLLSGGFPETSARSKVTYILRKGLPTIAIRCRPKPEGGEERIFLAALCSHPLGWFEGTHVGAYPPTDEVIANLLAIRGDEHTLWKKSNQHGLNDPLAGI